MNNLMSIHLRDAEEENRQLKAIIYLAVEKLGGKLVLTHEELYGLDDDDVSTEIQDWNDTVTITTGALRIREIINKHFGFYPNDLKRSTIRGIRYYCKHDDAPDEDIHLQKVGDLSGLRVWVGVCTTCRKAVYSPAPSERNDFR